MYTPLGEEAKKSSLTPVYQLGSTDQLSGYKSADETWLSTYDIHHILTPRTSRAHIMRMCKTYHYIKQFVPNVKWVGQWEPLEASHQEWMVNETHLNDFISSILSHSRLGAHEQTRICAKFPFISPIVKTCIESDLLDTLSQCCPFPMERQYRIGARRLDGFIPRLQMAIQIDENNHEAYNEYEEKEYNTQLRDLNIVLLRFPVLPSDNREKKALELVQKVWERTLSPDYKLFAMIHQLNGTLTE